MILCAEWIFPVTSAPLYRHAIEIRQGRISEIRSVRKSDVVWGDVCLLPGLINVHTHLAYTALRNIFDACSFFPWIRKLTQVKHGILSEKDIAASTQLGIHECLRAGITTVADLSDLEPSLRVLSRSPLRGIFYWEVFGVEKEQAETSWKQLKRIFPRLRFEYGSSRLQIGISPHACYTVRPELYSRIAKWAIAEEIPISFHVAESQAEEEFIGKQKGVIQRFLQKRAADWRKRGRTSVSHLEETGIFRTKPLLAHLVQVNPADLRLLADYDVSIAHCPKSNAKFGHGIAPVHKFLQKGFRVGIGSDSAASNNRIDLFEEGRFALLQQRSREKRMVLSEEKILEMLTIDGARALRLEDRIGSLEPGKEADIIAVRIPRFYTSSEQVLNHLVHNTCSTDVVRTIIAGKEVNVGVSQAGIRDIYRRIS